MQEGRLEAASPEMEAEEVPYGADWEGMWIIPIAIKSSKFCSINSKMLFYANKLSVI